MKKLIRNVVSLDMTKATPESVKGLTIKNAVNVYVTPTTRPLLGQIQFSNLVNLCEIPDGTAIVKINGGVVVDGNHDTTSDNGAYMCINGGILVKNDVSPESLRSYFSHGASANGGITLPDTLAALVPQLSITLNGEVRVYPADSLLYTHNVKINNGFLAGLPTASKVTIVSDDEIFIAANTDPEAFERHISQITVFGDVVVPESLTDAFYKTACQYKGVTVVPDGYTFHDRPLFITPSNILGLKGKYLYTRKNIIFKDGLDEQHLRQMDFRLETEGRIILPDGMADVLFDKVKAADLYTYRGQLVTVSDEMKLAEISELASLLINRGAVLSLHEDVSAADIKQNIGEIFLYGSLMVPENLVRPISDKIVVSKGNVEAISTETEEEYTPNNVNSEEAEYDIVISNAVEYIL